MFNNVLAFSHKINVFLNLEPFQNFYRFMKSVAYHEFIQLVYGRRVGKNRITLPACAYHAIRSKFQTKEKNEDMEN